MLEYFTVVRGHAVDYQSQEQPNFHCGKKLAKACHFKSECRLARVCGSFYFLSFVQALEHFYSCCALFDGHIPINGQLGQKLVFNGFFPKFLLEILP
jgi:hypothetical protein